MAGLLHLSLGPVGAESNVVDDPFDTATAGLAGHGRFALVDAVTHGREQPDHGFLEEGPAYLH